jgi:hypothetical protein
VIRIRYGQPGPLPIVSSDGRVSRLVYCLPVCLALKPLNELKRELNGYNMGDCKTAATVADALVRICGGDASGLDAVNVGSLEVHWRHCRARIPSGV